MLFLLKIFRHGGFSTGGKNSEGMFTAIKKKDKKSLKGGLGIKYPGKSKLPLRLLCMMTFQ